MERFFSKLRTAALAAAHRVADAAIDLDSVGAVRVHIRDLEGALEELLDAAAAETGNVKSLERAAIALRAQAQELDQNIDFLLRDEDESNDHHATPLQARLDSLRKTLQAKEVELETARQTEVALNEAASGLKAKHAVMVERVGHLESLERRARAQESAAEAMQSVTSAVAGVDGASVDNAEARLEKRAAVAGARFQRAMGQFASDAGQDVAVANAAAEIARRKAAIAAKKAAAAEMVASQAPAAEASAELPVAETAPVPGVETGAVDPATETPTTGA